MDETNERLARLETNVSQMRDTINNDLKHTLNKIWDKIDILPCAVHAEKFKSLLARMNWLYFAFVTVVLSGIVLGMWLKYL